MSTGGPYADRWHIGSAPRDPDQLADWLTERLGNLSRVLGLIQQRTEVQVASIEAQALVSGAPISLTSTSIVQLGNLGMTFTPFFTGLIFAMLEIDLSSGATGAVNLFTRFLFGATPNMGVNITWPANMTGPIMRFSGSIPVVGGTPVAVQVQYSAGAGSTYVANNARMQLLAGVPSSSLAVK